MTDSDINYVPCVNLLFQRSKKKKKKKKKSIIQLHCNITMKHEELFVTELKNYISSYEGLAECTKTANADKTKIGVGLQHSSSEIRIPKPPLVKQTSSVGRFARCDNDIDKILIDLKSLTEQRWYSNHQPEPVPKKRPVTAVPVAVSTSIHKVVRPTSAPTNSNNLKKLINQYRESKVSQTELQKRVRKIRRARLEGRTNIVQRNRLTASNDRTATFASNEAKAYRNKNMELHKQRRVERAFHSQELKIATTVESKKIRRREEQIRREEQNRKHQWLAMIVAATHFRKLEVQFSENRYLNSMKGKIDRFLQRGIKNYRKAKVQKKIKRLLYCMLFIAKVTIQIDQKLNATFILKATMRKILRTQHFFEVSKQFCTHIKRIQSWIRRVILLRRTRLAVLLMQWKATELRLICSEFSNATSKTRDAYSDQPVPFSIKYSLCKSAFTDHRRIYIKKCYSCDSEQRPNTRPHLPVNLSSEVMKEMVLEGIEILKQNMQQLSETVTIEALSYGTLSMYPAMRQEYQEEYMNDSQSEFDRYMPQLLVDESDLSWYDNNITISQNSYEAAKTTETFPFSESIFSIVPYFRIGGEDPQIALKYAEAVELNRKKSRRKIIRKS